MAEDVVMRGARRSYLSRSVERRERSHRRAVFTGLTTLLLLSAGPSLAHLVERRANEMLAGKDHLGALCIIALHELVAPLHSVFHLLLATGLVLAIYDRARAWLRSRRVLGSIELSTPAPGDAFWTAAARAGVDPHRVRVAAGLPNPAFTVGWLRPVILISRRLAFGLSPQELAAVLAHEGAHARRRDPLRLSLARFAARLLFWLPAMQRLAEDVADEAEISADDAAARGSEPLVLASALLAVANAYTPTPLAEGAVGFCRERSHDLLERRVLRLAGEDAPVRSHLTRGSKVIAAVALGIFWTSTVVDAHPLPAHLGAHTAAVHCEHRGVRALSHLFCRERHTADGHCPHAGM